MRYCSLASRNQRDNSVKTSKPSHDPRRRVLIVDDHPLLREGLGRVINQQDDLVVCGEAGDAPGGLSAVAKCRPDVVIVDISLEEAAMDLGARPLTVFLSITLPLIAPALLAGWRAAMVVRIAWPRSAM